MNFLTKNLFYLSMLITQLVSPIFAEEMISYQVEIYQLPKGDVADIEIDELIKRSELIHQPSLIVKPNEEAKIEIGIQDIRTLEISIKSDVESTGYSLSVSQKQKYESELSVMSSTTPYIYMGQEISLRISNDGWRYLVNVKGEIIEQP
ncbi:hypothetical protein [Paraglaciecola arctica]|uniref:hypothetical protein n=1 Tax=Paraglaciecola arctica TaxID=1128911 RepID=UPI001C07C6D0|nr:hypothetical protein [Paraglaciecola arctica]MBU3002379.1 hypothetical protein [Paraglaciecola arctica]